MANHFTDEELDKLAEKMTPKLIEQLEATHRDFYIDRETHYLDHLELATWRKNIGAVQRIFWFAFLGLAVLGMIVLVSIGLLNKTDAFALFKASQPPPAS